MFCCLLFVWCGPKRVPFPFLILSKINALLLLLKNRSIVLVQTAFRVALAKKKIKLLKHRLVVFRRKLRTKLARFHDPTEGEYQDPVFPPCYFERIVAKFNGPVDAQTTRSLDDHLNCEAVVRF